MSASNFPRTPHVPMKYPLKLGKSLRGRTALSRDILTMRFTQIPEKAQLHKHTSLVRRDDKCTVEAPTHDGGSVQFAGTRSTPKPDSVVNDYVLVLVDGVMWLERTSDCFVTLRAVDASANRPAPPYPSSPEQDDPLQDPDSWMPGADVSGTPITPEDDAELDDVPPVPQSRLAGKSAPPPALPHKRMLVTGGKVVKPDKPTPPPRPFAGKGVGGKGISQSAPPRRRPDQEEEDNDASSSEEDDSEDSDSDSSDSDDYTDRSSDEDD